MEKRDRLHQHMTRDWWWWGWWWGL